MLSDNEWKNHIKLTDMTVAKTLTIHAAAMNIVKL